MNANKNPKLKNRQKADILGRLMFLNAEHLALLLHTLRKVYPYEWYPAKIRKYINDFSDTVSTFECNNDSERKQALIDGHIKDVPYINYPRVNEAYRTLIMRAESELDKAIYHERINAEMLVENMLLMLMTLHYDYGYGQKRISRIIDAWAADRLREPLTWLDKVADAQLLDTAETRYEAFEYVQRLNRDKKRGVQVSAKEEAEARRKLEAMKKYQEVTAHEKP